ncbi:peptide-methionine (S)-S-oxide reductase MsrA [uncultured Sulfitobacter sp.]|uniref:peptide-methionine (S)-S-oxide reductase MsrA n=1 Tax=uncultured Sulfitobacter sp. TaxID=191468 RepID=UPI0026320658|nr:peptide-methionine (S)-S-oxide reductase MsrA [uncultured Sulfitobacter sp.]
MESIVNIIENLKVFSLAGLIVVGLFVQAMPAQAAGSETLTVAGGCFWCVEADFETVEGVTDAVSGYAGGATSNPTYKEVTGGNTGHYEVVQITFDPAIVSADTLLDLFFRSVDPTDAGGQFCDRGLSYRTAVFATDNQKTAAENAKADAEKELGKEVVTPVLSATKFYPAEAYHQDYAKGKKLVLTRFGPKSQANAYKAYRKACGRDARVKELWGSAAPFVD